MLCGRFIGYQLSKKSCDVQRLNNKKEKVWMPRIFQKQSATTAIFSLFAFLFMPAIGNAQSDKLEMIVDNNTFTPAFLIDRTAPRYPDSAAIRGHEGWVRVSYVIDKKGKVVDPIIEDYVGNRDFKRATIRALKKWRYEPATLNGKPVEQADGLVQIRYAVEQDKEGASRSFIRLSEKIIEKAEKDPNYDAAEDLAILQRKVKSLYEDAWYWWLLGQYYVQQGKPTETIRALSRSVAYDGKYLPEVLYDIAAQQLSNAEGQRVSREMGLTLDYNNDLKQTRLDDSGKKRAASVVNAKVGDNELWTYRILGTELAFENIKGKIDEVEVRCTRGRIKVKKPFTKAFKVPYTLGDCTLYLQGDEGISFRLRESVI